MKVLILFGHPAYQKSKINKTLLSGLESVNNLTLHDLYQAYPEMDIDIDFEQNLLVNHDCIIFQHPLYWYSTPAIFKEWMDLVLEHNFAFGSMGSALKGKLFFNALSAGAPRASFCSEGTVHYTINQLLAPIFQTGRLCKMNVLPPFVTYGTHTLSKAEILEQKEKYHALLHQIINDEIRLDEAKEVSCLTDYINTK